jgi:hypothetical protein
MEWLDKLIGLDALKIALLCIFAMLVLGIGALPLLKGVMKEGSPKPNGNGNGSSNPDRKWIERMDKHASRTHDLANTISQVVVRVESLERRVDKSDVKIESIDEKLDDLMPRITGVEINMANMNRAFSDLHSALGKSQRDLERMFELILNKLK